MSDRPLAIRDLKPSMQYMVRQGFTDFYHNQFKAGEILTFMSYRFLPYHGGHTVVFKEKSLYLQEHENADILDSLHEYLSPAAG